MSNEIMTIAPQQNSLTHVDPAAIAAAEGARAQIQAAFIMAFQKPRSYDLARVRILEACKRPSFAPRVQYTKPIGGDKTVSGGSIRFAEMLSREWGNILIKDTVIYDDETTRRISVTAIDLETNATLSKDIQLSKTVERSYGIDREILGERTNSKGGKTFIVRATEDEMQIKQESAVSKAKRNLVIALIPQEIVEEAIETAKRTMGAEDAANPGEARKKMVDLFYALGVKPTDIEDYLKHPLASCSPSELSTLRSIYTAIKDGDARWIDFVQKEEVGFSAKEEAKTMTEKLMNGGKKEQPGAEPDLPEEPPMPTDAPSQVIEESEMGTLLSHLDNLLGPDLLGFSIANRMKLAQAASGKRVKEIEELTEDELHRAVDIANKEIDKRGIGI